MVKAVCGVDTIYVLCDVDTITTVALLPNDTIDEYLLEPIRQAPALELDSRQQCCKKNSLL